MKTIRLTGIDRPAPDVVLGLMRIQDLDDDAVRTLVRAARDAGIDFFDHADVYGRDMHGCERRFAEAMRLSPSEREQITIQTKAGIVREGPYFDFSYEHLIEAVEGSLRALETDYIDILLLHRPDALVEPDEVARAFDELEAAGKVRAFGVSNHTPRQIDLLKKSVRQQLVANQIQLSITHAPSIAQGVAANMQGEQQSVTLDSGGIIDYCRLHDIAIQAWSPFQAGFLDHTSPGGDAGRARHDDARARERCRAGIRRRPHPCRVVRAVPRGGLPRALSPRRREGHRDGDRRHVVRRGQPIDHGVQIGVVGRAQEDAVEP